MPSIIDNTARSRFELEEQELTAYADYRREPGRLYIDYVFSPPPLRGQGTADRLMRGVVARAEAEKTKIVPICGYAAAWLKRHGEFGHLIA